MESCDVEDVVTELRQAVGVTGWPRPADHWRLVATVMGRGLIEVEFGRRSYVAVRADGVRVVTLRDGEGVEEAALEEVGHALFPRHPPSLFVPRGLALLNDLQEEHAARRFVLAWKLPADLVFGRLVSDVVRESGYPLEEVCERRRLLGWPR